MSIFQILNQSLKICDHSDLFKPTLKAPKSLVEPRKMPKIRDKISYL